MRFDSNDHYAGHSPYALYASRDGGAHWRGVLSTLGAVLPVHLPAGPGSHPGPFSVIDPERAFLLSPTPAAEATGAVLISQGSRLRRLPDIPETTLSHDLTAVGQLRQRHARLGGRQRRRRPGGNPRHLRRRPPLAVPAPRLTWPRS